MLYRVAQESVSVLIEPSALAEDLARVSPGAILEVVSYDKTRNWARVYAEGPPGEADIVGWIPLQHDVLGEVLVPL